MLSVYIEPWTQDGLEYGEYGCLERQIRREGDTISTDADVASVVLKAPMIWPRTIIPEITGPDYFWLTRWWTGHELLDWQMVGIPVQGLMGQENGADVTVGSAIRYIDRNIRKEVFEKYTSFLDIIHKGPVSIRFDADGKPTLLQSGIPFWGIYPWLETRNRMRVSQALDGGDIFAKWAVGLLATRFPWPVAATTEPYQIEGMCESVERHFWYNREADIVSGRSVVVASNNLLGVSTGWSESGMTQALGHAIAGLTNLRYHERQIRPGLYNSIRDRWMDVRRLLAL